MRLSTILSTSIQRLREELDQPFARIALVAMSPGSATLAQRALGSQAAFVQVRATFPEELLNGLGARLLLTEGLRPEPAGWLSATVLSALREGPDDLRDLARPRWAAALASAVSKLEGAGVEASTLRSTDLDPPDDPARVDLLAYLLEEIARARREAGLFSAADRARAALRGVASPPRALVRDAAYVVLGDKPLSPLGHRALAAWLGGRPGVRITVAPRVADAPCGLQRAARSYPREELIPEGETDLAVIQGTPRSSGEVAPDGTVRVVQALDERREAREAVRHVLNGVAEGIPLDRIAIALPTAAQADLVGAELDRAHVPFVSLVGPPLSSLPQFGLLRTLASTDAGALRPEGLHALLHHPDLSRELIPASLRRTRGRWRRLLVQVGPIEGLSTIMKRLAAPGPAEDEPARVDLLDACRRVEALLEGRPWRAPWGEHLATWRGLADRGLRSSRGKERIRQALLGPPAGAPLDRPEAVGLLEQMLAAQPVLQGSLNDPAVRVLPPMEMIAADADLVVVCGLAEGVFPQPPREDPLLSDRLISALAAKGYELESSSVREELEKRRFAAAVGSARGRLVLSLPRSELLNGRPRQPGLLLLDVARRLNWATTFETLSRQVIEPANTNAAGDTHEPEQAIDPAEHHRSLLAQSAQAGFAALSAHPFAPGLVRLHLALDRLQRAQDNDEWRPCSYTGLVDPALLSSPVTGSEPIHISVLDRALFEPMRHLVEDMLGARRPRRFEASASRHDRRASLGKVLGLIAPCLHSVESPDALWDELEARVSEHVDLELIRPDLARLRDELSELRAADKQLSIRGVQLQSEGGLLAGDALVDLRLSGTVNQRRFRVDQASRAALLLMAHGESGSGEAPPDRLFVYQLLSSKGVDFDRRSVEAELAPLLDVHLKRVRRGAYFAPPPSGRGGPRSYTLQGEAGFQARDDLERVRSWLGEELGS